MPLSRKPLVVITRRLPETVEARMGELFDVRLNETDRPMSRDELAQARVVLREHRPHEGDELLAEYLHALLAIRDARDIGDDIVAGLAGASAQRAVECAAQLALAADPAALEAEVGQRRDR